MKTYIEKDFEAMSQKSASLIAQVVNQKPDALISLPAGSTAARTFAILKDMSDKKDVDFSNASFVALDEWVGLEDESENCANFMLNNFYNPLNIDKAKIAFFDVHAQDLQAECKRIDNVIFSHGGIDCMLLGIGMNGHLGLNEPNQGFDDYAKVVELDSVTMQVGQKYFQNGMKLTRGITLGIKHMFETGLVILQAGGEHKADIIEKTYLSQTTPAIPATVLKALPNSIIVLDEDAASKIKNLV